MENDTEGMLQGDYRMIKGLSHAVTRAMTGCDGRPQRDSVSSPRRAGASPDDPLKHNTDDKSRRCAIRERMAP